MKFLHHRAVLECGSFQMKPNQQIRFGKALDVLQPISLCFFVGFFFFGAIMEPDQGEFEAKKKQERKKKQAKQRKRKYIQWG